MENNYFYIDGSSLLGDVNRLWHKKPAFKGKKLNVSVFYRHFTGDSYRQFVGDGYRRFTIYFVSGETRLKEYLEIPSFNVPNTLEDFQIKFSGKKLQGTKRFQNWIDSADPPQYVMDRLNKSEKAVDTQICCDALQLASNNRLDRLFVYTNDFDFMPLFDTLKSMGSNVSLIRLFAESTNKDLVSNSDSFCVPGSKELDRIFGVET